MDLRTTARRQVLLTSLASIMVGVTFYVQTLVLPSCPPQPPTASAMRAIAPNGVDAVIDASGHGEIPGSIELAGGPERVLTLVAFDALPGVFLGPEDDTSTSCPVPAVHAGRIPYGGNA